MAKRGALTHRKTRRLARCLGGIPLPYALGIVEALWHATQTHTPDGAIGRLSDDDIAEEMWWDEEPAKLVSALVESGFVDEHPEHRLIVHGWAEHADAPTHMALARKRLYFASGEAPTLNRLPHGERQAAAAFYDAAGDATSSESGSVRTDPDSLRTESESVRTKAHGKRTASRIPAPPRPAPVEEEPPYPPAGGGSTAPAAPEAPEAGEAQTAPDCQDPGPEPNPYAGWTQEQVDAERDRILADMTARMTGVDYGTHVLRGKLAEGAVFCRDLADAWKARFGGPPAKPREFGRVMAPLVAEYGHDEVLDRWRRYLDAVESRFASAASFASKFGEWAAKPTRQKPHLRDAREIIAEDHEAVRRGYESLSPEIRERWEKANAEERREITRQVIAGEIAL